MNQCSQLTPGMMFEYLAVILFFVFVFAVPFLMYLDGRFEPKEKRNQRKPYDFNLSNKNPYEDYE